jgi:hypothetical protein
MGLLDDLTPTRRQFSCRVREAAEDLDTADSERLYEAVGNIQAWTAKGLARELTKRGITISDHSINRHRSGECSCSKI